MTNRKKQIERLQREFMENGETFCELDMMRVEKDARRQRRADAFKRREDREDRDYN